MDLRSYSSDGLTFVFVSMIVILNNILEKAKALSLDLESSDGDSSSDDGVKDAFTRVKNALTAFDMTDSPASPGHASRFVWYCQVTV